MPLFGGFGVLLLALWVFCIVDVITSEEWEIRNLPKLAWLFIVLLLPDVGSIVWLIAGRPQRAGRAARPVRPVHGPARFPEYDRPGRHLAVNPDDDEEFLRRCRERAEEQRRAARERRQADGES
jgi:hypothetical protein